MFKLSIKEGETAVSRAGETIPARDKIDKIIIIEFILRKKRQTMTKGNRKEMWCVTQKCQVK